MGYAPMQAGQKQALAIAYQVRNRLARSKGPPNEENMGRNDDSPYDRGGENRNAMLDPGTGGTEIRDKIYGDQRLSDREQAHGQVPQPAQPGASYKPSRGTNPIRPEPDQAQAKFSEEDESQHLASGGMVKEAMSRRERALMAARGGSHAEVREGVGKSPNEASEGKGKTAHNPFSKEDVRSGPPSSNKISREDQQKFADGGEAEDDGGGVAGTAAKLAPMLLMLSKGGEVDHDEIRGHVKKLAGHYAEGGAVNAVPAIGGAGKYAPTNAGTATQAEHKEDKDHSADSGPGALKEGFSDLTKGIGSRTGLQKQKKMAHGGYASPNLDIDEQGAMFAGGGQIASKIRERKMAMGGKVYEDDDRPEGDESIDNFRRESHPDNDFLSGEEQSDYRHLHPAEEDEEAEAPKRKGMLDRIMRGIQARNGSR